MVSYKELIGFLWQFMRLQKWVFILILLLDAFTWPLDVLLWPYILHVVIDIFSRYEGDRMAAWEALKSDHRRIVFDNLRHNGLSHDGLLNGKSGPKAPNQYSHDDV